MDFSRPGNLLNSFFCLVWDSWQSWHHVGLCELPSKTVSRLSIRNCLDSESAAAAAAANNSNDEPVSITHCQRNFPDDDNEVRDETAACIFGLFT